MALGPSDPSGFFSLCPLRLSPRRSAPGAAGLVIWSFCVGLVQDDESDPGPVEERVISLTKKSLRQRSDPSVMSY